MEKGVFALNHLGKRVATSLRRFGGFGEYVLSEKTLESEKSVQILRTIGV